jgi:hypothetical protein
MTRRPTNAQKDTTVLTESLSASHVQTAISVPQLMLSPKSARKGTFPTKDGLNASLVKQALSALWKMDTQR